MALRLIALLMIMRVIADGLARHQRHDVASPSPDVDRVRRGEDVAGFVTGDDLDARRRVAEFERWAVELERIGKPELAVKMRAAA
jgi:hypothetical protein